MSIETFSVSGFDGAMREIAPTARCIGVRQGEYVWVIPVVPDESVGVIVRSSIREDRTSAEAGADSIRAWLGRIPDGVPYAPKLSSRWTRRAGWESRLRRVIAELIVLAGALRPCPACGAWMKLGGRGGDRSTRLYCDARVGGFLDFGADGVMLEIPGKRCGTELPLLVTDESHAPASASP